MTLSNPSSLPIWPIGWTVRHVPETGSTNDDLVAAGNDGAADRTVIVADYQTSGKGRLDRTWEATRGTNLLVSFLFRCANEDLHRYPRIVALSARAVCERHAGANVMLKWPNDLVIDDRKLAGILSVAVPRDEFIVVGLGVNVGWAPPEAIALGDSSTTPLVLLTEILAEIDVRRAMSDVDLHHEHRAVLSTLGRRVRVELRAAEDLVGVAEELDEQSRLVLLDEHDRRHVIDVGDVIHLRSQ